MLTTAFSSLNLPWILANCNFEKTSTLPIVLFELFIFSGVGVSFLVLSKIKDRLWFRFLVMAIAVFTFELFTMPMWHNYHMGFWAYLYSDISWILTIGWTALFLSVVTLTDQLLPGWKEPKRFMVYLVILALAVPMLEAVVVNIGIRSYSPEVLQSLSRIFVWNVPIEVLYYSLVFSTLIIAFYKYWSFVLDQPLIPLKKRQWVRSFFLAFIAVFLFEVMVEPMVNNEKFPAWSYIFHDISFILIGAWILVIGATAGMVGKFFMHLPAPLRFCIAIGISSSFAFPLEAWLIHSGYRVYQANTLHSYSGIVTPTFHLPIEIGFAVPLYMALMIAFIRYWETVLDNRF